MGAILKKAPVCIIFYLLTACALQLFLPPNAQGSPYQQADLAGNWLVKFANGRQWTMSFDERGNLTSWVNPRASLSNPHGTLEVKKDGSITGTLEGTYYSPKSGLYLTLILNLEGHFASPNQINMKGTADRRHLEPMLSQGEPIACLWSKLP